MGNGGVGAEGAGLVVEATGNVEVTVGWGLKVLGGAVTGSGATTAVAAGLVTGLGVDGNGALMGGLAGGWAFKASILDCNSDSYCAVLGEPDEVTAWPPRFLI